jgi:fos-like antigen, invertebrate
MPNLNTPTFLKINKPNRPSSLNVPANLKPSDVLSRKNVSDIAGISVNTPSSGMFNFDSLMEGGTGLTPVNPCIQVPCSTQNRHPLEMLQTPTSENSKLCSL